MSGRSGRHMRVLCNKCSIPNFTGIRYKCLRCPDYDLCQRCFEGKREFLSGHLASHPMQSVILKEDFPKFYAGDPDIIPGYHVSFTCPICGKVGLEQDELVAHIRKEHLGDTSDVICPVCVGTPGFSDNLRTRDLLVHLISRHPVVKRNVGAVAAAGTASNSAVGRKVLEASSAGPSVQGRFHGLESDDSSSSSCSEDDDPEVVEIVSRVAPAAHAQLLGHPRRVPPGGFPIQQRRGRPANQVMPQPRGSRPASSGRGFEDVLRSTGNAWANAPGLGGPISNSMLETFFTLAKASAAASSFGSGQVATPATTGSAIFPPNSAGTAVKKEDPFSHPWELSPGLIEEMERNQRNGPPPTKEDEELAAATGLTMEEIAEKKELKKTIVRAAFLQELFWSLLTLKPPDESNQSAVEGAEEKDEDEAAKTATEEEV